MKPEIFARLLAMLKEPTSINQICERFTISKPTALSWLIELADRCKTKLVVDERREGKRGPFSRTYQVKL